MPSSSVGYAAPLPAANPFPGNQPQAGGPYFVAGAPTGGTSCVQTVTIGGTPTGGTFTLTFGGQTTGSIAWTATDATLASNIATALNALANIGPSGVAGSVGTGSSGIGTYLVTFQGQNADLTVPAITVGANSLVGTSPTVSVAVTTAGVTATIRGATPGTEICDYVNNRCYINTGTAAAPTWTRNGPNMAVVPLTATTATGGGKVASWQPAEGGPILITRTFVWVQTVSTGAANVTVGTAVNNTTSANNLVPATSVHSATGTFDNISTQIIAATAAESGFVGGSLPLAAGSYVNVTGSADTTGLVGYLVIEYIKP